tara:strand:- start:190 stop:1101 length:912 start_codon:yes stop_codon:yes gene_type:complete
MIVTSHETEQQWLQARKKGIGASECAAVLGYSNWQTALSVWEKKVSPDVDAQETSPMCEWGHRHEWSIGEKFCEVFDAEQLSTDTGIKDIELVDLGKYATAWRENEPLFCTPDRVIVGVAAETPIAALEIKTAYYDRGKEWNDRIPREYRCQLQHAMYCLGVDYGYYAVLINGYDFRWYKDRRHDKFLSMAIPRMLDFWEMVKAKVPPDPSWQKVDSQALARIHGDPQEEVVDLPEELQEAYREIESYENLIKATERKRDQRKNDVRAAMGNATAARDRNGSGFTWIADKNGKRTLRKKEQMR